MRALLIVALCAACSSRTQVVVLVHSGDLLVPVDLDTVRLTVTNPNLSGDDAIRFDRQLVLCGGGRLDCAQPPISMTLHPGPERAQDPVRVRVSALRQGVVVQSDAAVFRFRGGESAHLDFVLSRACLGTNCDANDQSCGEGTCRATAPLPFASELDLRAPAGDLGAPDLLPPPCPVGNNGGLNPQACGTMCYRGSGGFSAPPDNGHYSIFDTSATIEASVMPLGGDPGVRYTLVSVEAGYGLYYENGQLAWKLNFSDGVREGTGPALPLGEWKHVALRWHSSPREINLFVDGVSVITPMTLADTGPRSIAANGPLVIGGTGATVFWGSIDEVRISNFPRTSFPSGRGRLTRDAVTMALFHFDEIGMTQADNDSSAGTVADMPVRGNVIAPSSIACIP